MAKVCALSQKVTALKLDGRQAVTSDTSGIENNLNIDTELRIQNVSWNYTANGVIVRTHHRGRLFEPTVQT